MELPDLIKFVIISFMKQMIKMSSWKLICFPGRVIKSLGGHLDLKGQCSLARITSMSLDTGRIDELAGLCLYFFEYEFTVCALVFNLGHVVREAELIFQKLFPLFRCPS